MSNSHLTIDQLQTRYTDLDHRISDAVKEQHRLCEELMTRVDRLMALMDQDNVDWHIVNEAVSDALSDAEGFGVTEKLLKYHFLKHGLFIVHREDLVVASAN